MTGWEIFLVVGVVVALLAPAVCRAVGPVAAWVVALFPASAFAYGLAQIGGKSALVSRSWAPEYGLNFTTQIDQFGLLFWLLVSGIGTLIVVYSGAYMKPADLGRLLFNLLLFMVAMLGVSVAANVLTLFVFWELTSLTSFLLIGFKHSDPAARRSALQALLVTGLGGLVLLAGLILLAVENQTPVFAQMTSASPLAVALVAIGCFTKSAQFPFHFWLPNAMAAPTPISAYLHSATMVKLGVFLLAKLAPVFGPQTTIAAFGGATLLIGSILALLEKDLKRILAWSTVAALGNMVLLIGLVASKVAEALVLTILAHALYKGALFMTAGALDHMTGTRDARALRGLAKRAPFLAVAATLAALSMAGLIPLAGFVAKELALAAVTAPWALLLLLIGAISNVVVAANVALRPFWQNPEPDAEPLPEKHPATFGLTLGPAVLAIAGLVAGILVTPLSQAFLAPAASLVYGQTVTAKATLWAGFNAALAITAIGLVGGVILALQWPRAFPGLEATKTAAPLTMERIFVLAFKNLSKVAQFTTDLVERTSVRTHIVTYFVALTAAILAVTIPAPPLLDWPKILQDADPHEIVVTLAAAVAAVATIAMKNRMAAVATIGVVGIAISVTFVSFGAPDLALTQVLIEILTVVLFVLVFAALPSFQSLTKPAVRYRDAAIAGVFGVLMAFLVLAVISAPEIPSINIYFAQNSFPVAFGRNVVNTILVDFRAIDTLGEITVLCAAALGVHNLVRLRPAKQDQPEQEQPDLAQNGQDQPHQDRPGHEQATQGSTQTETAGGQA